MPKLLFKDGDYSTLSAVSPYVKWPLRINVTGPEVGLSQSYILNENELVALFNLLSSIIRESGNKLRNDLMQSNDYSNLHD